MIFELDGREMTTREALHGHLAQQLNLPEWRLTAIEAQIQRRVRQLLAMPRR